METLQQRFLSVKQASEYSGYTVKYLYRLTGSKAIPFSKPNGKKIFIDREKLDTWLRNNENNPEVIQSAISGEAAHNG